MEDIFEPLRAPIVAAASKAVSDAFDEIEMETLFEVFQAIVNNDPEPFWVEAGTSEAEVNISISLDDEFVLTTESAPISEVAWFWPDCWRSQASVIFALEASVANMRARFEQEFGIPFNRSELEREAAIRFPKDRFPGATHKFWPDKDQAK